MNKDEVEIAKRQLNSVYCAFLDDFITLDDFKELSKYADKLSYYLKECLE